MVAYFPTNYFLENLAVRKDNPVLVSAMNHKELWYVPPSVEGAAVDPIWRAADRYMLPFMEEVLIAASMKRRRLAADLGSTSAISWTRRNGD